MDIKKYKQVQKIAKETIEFLKTFINEGLSAKEIKNAAEKFMIKKGINSFWYYNVGALVFIGKQTTISISGKNYKASNVKVKSEDLVTVDLSPEINGYWGDFARSFVIQNGKVIKTNQSKSSEINQGIKTEIKLHENFKKIVNEKTSFEEAYIKLNSLIEELGFVNLDFNKNLGHSIEKNKNDRIYIKAGNKAKFKNVDLFTFEPHIKKKGGKYGFKMENIYYFNKGKIEVL
ncbi:MAG: methionine aminopeptidase [Candidatus Peregrinibacteria bacterium GW2011_GWC2_39_14]|nr:MAG: methionine aminopeptidase [Candidatus Peregrinibacteria bacterium GW2011_GWA2_38_36]KKR05865.1 MAG: methionine aminopeptidase [Candidatus Peregrinibacteria bacterium GW2011_GWC2_39_14]